MSKLCCSLPIDFDNDLRVTDYTGMCNACGQGIPCTNIEADIHRWSQHVVMIHGKGVCPDCGATTDIHVYIHDDKSVRQLIRGQWVMSCDSEPSLKGRLAHLIMMVLLVAAVVSAAVGFVHHKPMPARLVYHGGQIYTVTEQGVVGANGQIQSLPREAIRQML